MNQTDDKPKRSDSETIPADFRHRTFEERLAEYDDEISGFVFDWGEPVGLEML